MPESVGSWEMDYYDPVAYAENGTMKLLTMSGERQGAHFAQVLDMHLVAEREPEGGDDR